VKFGYEKVRDALAPLMAKYAFHRRAASLHRLPGYTVFATPDQVLAFVLSNILEVQRASTIKNRATNT
jgi:hypothetical protein